ncbi:MAG: GntR family transcriptional regulator [Colwellia sp.]|nr:GntR family transcriptional regulator [Colwellia sp.]
MTTNSINSVTIVEQIINAIRDAIKDGRLIAGQRLIVADISKEFSVSFGPVREAIRRLAGEGYLAFIPHKGASVKAFGAKEIREFFQTREAIEGFVAKLAAENIARVDYSDRMKECQIQLNKLMVDGTLKESTDIRQYFHDLLYEIVGNSLLKDTGLKLTYPLQRIYFNDATGKSRTQDSLEEHNEIINAVMAGEGYQAERKMRAHLRNRSAAACDVLDEMNQKSNKVA